MCLVILPKLAKPRSTRGYPLPPATHQEKQLKMSPSASPDEPNLSAGDAQDTQQGGKNQSEAITMVEGEMIEPPESDSLRDNQPFWEQSEEGQAGASS